MRYYDSRTFLLFFYPSLLINIFIHLYVTLISLVVLKHLPQDLFYRQMELEEERGGCVGFCGAGWVGGVLWCEVGAD